MEKTPGISQAEWQVMKVLWWQSPLTATEVYEALEESTGWHAKTVRTLLGRLVAKGVVKREKRAGSFRFWPVLDEATCVGEESRTFLERCFSGRLGPMLAHFIENEDLTPDDVRSLRALLDERDGEDEA